MIEARMGGGISLAPHRPPRHTAGTKMAALKLPKRGGKEIVECKNLKKGEASEKVAQR